MKNNFKLSALSLAIFSAMAAPHSFSQETGPKASDDGASHLEEVVVTGFRQSIQRAVDAKRNSDSVSDSIYAEDVGKSTDQNIADALSRVTGVTVTDEGGEGSRISVRGAASYMNQVSMNGVALTSGSTGGLDPNGSGQSTADQSVDLSAISSDILASIDVVKTSSADQNEGSLGANVILHTLHPLSLNAPRRSFRVQERYNGLSAKNDYALNGSYADKFFDDTVGLVFTTSYDNYKYRQDAIHTSWQQDSIRISDADTSVDPGGARAYDVATGKPIRVAHTGTTYDTLDKLPGYDAKKQVGTKDLYVLARDTSAYALSQNDRKRWTSNLGIQFQPFDSTDIQLDLSYSDNKRNVDYNSVRYNWAPSVAYTGYGSDTTNMIGVDLANNTMQTMKASDRGGMLSRTKGLNEIKTSVASLRWDQQLTDTLSMKTQIGWSRTTDNTDHWVGAGTAVWGTTNKIPNNEAKSYYDFVGYDCTTGDCSVYSGKRKGSYDPVYGTWSDVHSKFVPNDLYANHLGNLWQTFRDQSDTNLSLHLDFDWSVDAFYITDVEFGIKAADREKDVFTQRQRAQNSSTLIDVSNPSISYGGQGMDGVHLADMLATGAFPVDNFADGLVTDRSNTIFQGWPQIDPDKALTAFTGQDPNSVSLRTDPSNSRTIETTTQAAYLKGNFELMDGRLSGNVGVRYVKDKNDATAYGSIQYYRGPHQVDWYDLIVNRQLANTNLPACDVPSQDVTTDPAHPWANRDDLDHCYDWRIDHAYDYDNPNTIPVAGGVTGSPQTGTPSPAWRFLDANGDPDYSVNRILQVDYSDPAHPVITQNDPVPTQIYEMKNGQLQLTGYKDRLRTRAFRGGLQPYVDYSTAFTGPAGNTPEANFRSAPTADSATYDMWLPSLNLNYILNDDTVLRFAASKTMSRPRFDSLAPRLSINENTWDTYARGSSGNTALKPLVSKNLDLSYEWYFGDGDMLSVALFHKDMSDFEENVDTKYYYKDIRSDYDVDNLDILLPHNDTTKPGEKLADGSECMPHRMAAAQTLDPVVIECHTAVIAQVQNGLGQTISGVELGYTQTFDSLPGLLSGLGLSMNYTYQESKSDKEKINGTDVYRTPMPAAHTPKHSANTTLFWSNDDWDVRLAHQYSGIELVNGGVLGGAIWQDPTQSLDFSSTYHITDKISVGFQALNLTDDITRTFYTARDREVGSGASATLWNEGNPMDDSGVYDGRTVSKYRIGRSFRVSLEMSF